MEADDILFFGSAFPVQFVLVSHDVAGAYWSYTYFVIQSTGTGSSHVDQYFTPGLYR